MGERTVIMRLPGGTISAQLPNRRLHACPVCANPDLSIDYATGSTLCREPICRAQWYDEYSRTITLTSISRISTSSSSHYSGLADAIEERAREMYRRHRA